MKNCLACQAPLNGESRVIARKKFCSSICRSKYRTISGARIDNHLWTNFRIRETQYNDMLVKQNFSCAICKVHQSETEKALAVDHDHSCCPGKKSCGKCIRGLLCFECNIGLGKFKDNPRLLAIAYEYLSSSCDVVDIGMTVA